MYLHDDDGKTNTGKKSKDSPRRDSPRNSNQQLPSSQPHRNYSKVTQPPTSSLVPTAQLWTQQAEATTLEKKRKLIEEQQRKIQEKQNRLSGGGVTGKGVPGEGRNRPQSGVTHSSSGNRYPNSGNPNQQSNLEKTNRPTSGNFGQVQRVPEHWMNSKNRESKAVNVQTNERQRNSNGAHVKRLSSNADKYRDTREGNFHSTLPSWPPVATNGHRDSMDRLNGFDRIQEPQHPTQTRISQQNFNTSSNPSQNGSNLSTPRSNNAQNQTAYKQGEKRLPRIPPPLNLGITNPALVPDSPNTNFVGGQRFHGSTSLSTDEERDGGKKAKVSKSCIALVVVLVILGLAISILAIYFGGKW